MMSTSLGWLGKPYLLAILDFTLKKINKLICSWLYSIYIILLKDSKYKHPDEFKCFQLILTRFQLATHFFISKKEFCRICWHFIDLRCFINHLMFTIVFTTTGIILLSNNLQMSPYVQILRGGVAHWVAWLVNQLVSREFELPLFPWARMFTLIA